MGNLPKASQANVCFPFGCGVQFYGRGTVPDNTEGNMPMSWTTPTLVEVCVGLEINGYLPPEF
jgi:coenzyme PQQ precursor peptide PqqA